MIRRPCSILAALSLLLCLATSVAWISSYVVGEQLLCVRYFTYLTRPRMLVEGFDSNQGDLILTQVFTDTLTPDDLKRGVSSDFGELAVDRGHFPPFNTSSWLWHRGTLANYAHNKRGLWDRLGFHSRAEFGYRDPSWSRQLFVPYYAIVLFFALSPAIMLARRASDSARRRRRRSRSSRGLCAECGYDLRGSPGSCPECGSAPMAR